jgi:hypothetical protein
MGFPPTAPDGLPVIPDTALPAAVRTGSAATKQDYQAAMGFEQVMLGQLVKEMLPQDSELTDGPYGDEMQQAMTSSLVDGGGIGLGRQLFSMMQGTAK